MAQSDDQETDDRTHRIRQIVNDCVVRRAEGEQITDQSLVDAHPDLLPELADELRNLRMIEEAERQANIAATQQSPGLHIRCPHCHNAIEIVEEMSLSDVVCPSCGSHLSLVDEPQTFQAGALETIGHFKLLDKLGAGAFGSVWSAKDVELDRTVAIKIPRKGQLSPEDTEQFIREARAAAQLSHPHIIPVHEVGREGDRVYIVSEFVHGVNLADWLVERKPTPREAAELCATVADALHHAHQHGVIHRDLKPSNIMLDRDAQPHLMDFGLAKREAGEVTMTVEGKLIGTPAYMSPEQAHGAAHEADRRSDIYSLGVILYEVLTGERPFRGSTQMLLHQILVEDAASPRKFNCRIPKDLETLCLKCLEKEPDRRYQTARALTDDLQRFLRGESVCARPISRLERAWRWCKRKPVVAGLGATVALLLLVLGVVGPLMAINQKRLRRMADHNANQESVARRQAVEARDDARRLLYVSDMNVAQQALQQAKVGRAIELLERHQPQSNDEDLRGFGWYYLWGVCERAIMASRFEREPILDVIFSPDGATLTSATARGIRRHSVASFEVLQGHSIDVNGVNQQAGGSAVELSPDGKTCAMGLTDGKVRLTVVNTGQTTNVGRHSKRVKSVAFSPDGNVLASGATDGSIRLWDVATGKPLAPVAGHDGIVYCLTFSPDGSVLASGARDGLVKLWDVASGRIMQEPLDTNLVSKNRSRVWSVAFSPDGKNLATGTSGDYLVLLWDVPSGQLVRNLGRHKNFVTSVAFSSDGELLASGCKAIKLWNVASGELIDTLLSYESETIGSLVFSPDRSVLASASAVGGGTLWSLSAPANMRVLKHSESIRCGALSPDGKTFAAGEGRGRSVILWDVNTGQERARLPRMAGSVQSLAYSPDGRHLAMTTWTTKDEPTTLWNADTGRFERTFPSLSKTQGPTTTPVRTRTPVRRVAFSPKGKLLAVGGREGAVTLWDIRTTERIKVLPGQDADVQLLTFTPDGKTLAASRQTGIELWDTQTWQLSNELPWPMVTSMAFSPDGTILALTDELSNLNLWNVAIGEVKRIPGHGGHDVCVVFSPDGTRVISAGDGEVKFWDVSTGQLRFQLAAHDATIWSIAVTPDGRTLVTGGSDDTVKLWRAATENDVRRMRRRLQQSRQPLVPAD